MGWSGDWCLVYASRNNGPEKAVQVAIFRAKEWGGQY
jgi:hypothetical protein